MARIERDAGGAPSAAGEITIAIADDDQAVTVTITDNGIGLPLESRARLTEPYVTTRVRGTGLGLAIVKKIIEDHGGSLELGDAPGATGAFARVRLSRAMATDSMPTETALPFKLSA